MEEERVMGNILKASLPHPGVAYKGIHLNKRKYVFHSLTWKISV
jgi:hypothetical protein